MTRAAAVAPVLAAGAVCWRIVDGEVRVLVVHRTQHRDVSLPKGKLDPGETLPQTARRELLEETGLDVALGAPLGTIDYRLPNGRPKVVHYWSAEVSERDVADAATRFSPNDEIAELAWEPIGTLRDRLSYEHDGEVVDRLVARLDAGTARTFAIIALRHGKAIPPGAWDGPDATRPLLARGEQQAASVAPAIAAYSPAKLISSPARRCLATIAPLAALTALPVKESADISQDAFETHSGDVARVVAKRLRKRVTAVLCSHGPVLPVILEELGAHASGKVLQALRRASDLGTADYAVVHLTAGDGRPSIVAVETHGPASAAS